MAQTIDTPMMAAAPGQGRWDRWLWLGAVAMVWWFLCDRLRVDWTVNAQYSYGWVVPLLGLGVFWRRWVWRPDPVPAGRARAGVLVGAALLLALTLPIRLVEEANPEWRLLLWAHALQAVGLTLAVLVGLGGWSWGRHFLFPVAFLLMAVPWPMRLETAVIQGLMRFVAAVTVELLGWVGIPAIQHGNVIELSRGIVGVDEACSGVRSLQTALLVSLFLGELYLLRPAWRVGLLAAGLALAVGANVGRAFFLSWVAARQGLDALHGWHDAAGLAVVGVIVGALWGLAVWTRGAAPAARTPGPARPLPRLWAVAVVFWLVGVEATVEAWYRTREADLIENPSWTLAWPVGDPAYAPIEITEKVQAILRCSASRGVAWSDAAGHRWQGFLLRWEPGKNSAQLAKGHRPEICLPGVGLKLREELEACAVAAGGLTLRFRHYVFDGGAGPIHVFYGLWDDLSSPVAPALTEDGSLRSRLEAVRFGKRHQGQQVVELALSGPVDPASAVDALTAELNRLLLVGRR
jgi:exosortase